MAGITTIRSIIAFLLSAACIAQCQRADKTDPGSLPDAPSVQTADHPASSQAQPLPSFQNAMRSPVTALPRTDWDGPARLSFENSRPPARQESSDPLTRFLSARSLPGKTSPDASIHSSFIGQVTHAASSILVTHDATGASKLNTRYLLAVLTSAAAQSAHTPYWRRSPSQPFSDFGTTIGNDAGMNVFHEFEPGLRQALKSHEPKFVTRIEEHDSSSIDVRISEIGPVFRTVISLSYAKR